MIDNHIYWGNALNIDVTPYHLAARDGRRRPGAARDRRLAQRHLRRLSAREQRHHGRLGGSGDPVPGLRKSWDLEERLGNIIIGYRFDKTAVFARDLKADSTMAVLLKDAMQPNLVQTLENNPALGGNGPFANIAHGCNSVSSPTRTALKACRLRGDGGRVQRGSRSGKFFDIKCRKMGAEARWR